MSYSIDVEDNGSPGAALDAAGQAVRDFNHRSTTRFQDQQEGWRYVPDVYRCLGELTYLVGMLPQVTQHMSQAMQYQLEQGHVGIDRGSDYEGRPEQAITAARAALALAEGAAHELYGAYAAAQTAINRAHYAGPAIVDDAGQN